MEQIKRLLLIIIIGFIVIPLPYITAMAFLPPHNGEIILYFLAWMVGIMALFIIAIVLFGVFVLFASIINFVLYGEFEWVHLIARLDDFYRDIKTNKFFADFFY